MKLFDFFSMIFGLPFSREYSVATAAVLAFLWNRHMGLLHRCTPKAALISICILAKKSPLKSFPTERQKD